MELLQPDADEAPAAELVPERLVARHHSGADDRAQVD